MVSEQPLRAATGPKMEPAGEAIHCTKVSAIPSYCSPLQSSSQTR